MSLFNDTFKYTEEELKELKMGKYKPEQRLLSSTQFNDETILIFKLMELIANKRYDGHYTIMKFTTNYRFCFGTLYIKNDIEYRVAISLMAKGETLDEAILNAITDRVDCYNIQKKLPQAVKEFEDEIWN